MDKCDHPARNGRHEECARPDGSTYCRACGKELEPARFGFDGKMPIPAKPEAENFAKLLLDIFSAEKELKEAVKRVPAYTKQWDSSDYTAQAEENWNRAADKLYLAMEELVKNTQLKVWRTQETTDAIKIVTEQAFKRGFYFKENK